MSLPRVISKKNSHRGQAMVEFIFVVVFVFLLFVGILQMILLMHAYNTLADAAKEGVRYAIVHGTENNNCSGPGNSNATPPVTCTGDPSGQNVITTVLNFGGLSFQNLNADTDVNVSYNPQDQNGTCANGKNGSCSGSGCSAPGCMVRVTVSHKYAPLFGLGWPTFTLNAAANGRIIN